MNVVKLYIGHVLSVKFGLCYQPLITNRCGIPDHTLFRLPLDFVWVSNELFSELELVNPDLNVCLHMKHEEEKLLWVWPLNKRILNLNHLMYISILKLSFL